MSRVIKMSTPKGKPASLPKTAALTRAQAEHKAWLKARGIKVTKEMRRNSRLG
jgi:hypothetical protein